MDLLVRNQDTSKKRERENKSGEEKALYIVSITKATGDRRSKID
jgi:hypothetical protein